MISGIKHFFSGFTLIFSQGLKRFVLIPLAINISIFALGFWLGMEWFDRFLVKMLPTWLAWAEFILWPIFALSYFLIVFYLFALIANIIAAPFNGLLAEKVELSLRNDSSQNNQSAIKQLLKELPRTVGSEIYKLFYFLLRSLPILILFLIPGINLIAPIIWFAFSAWMLSLEYLDYPLGNHGIFFKQTRVLAKQQRARCLSFGALVSVFTMIPVLNFIVMPVAVAGATALYVDSIHPIQE
ncbi:MAG: sulfate transporter CysZ [Gammaproteobacteria bacterium]|nr:sulfate transporter CysZ [Gammaproteobacteria bacterium]